MSDTGLNANIYYLTSRYLELINDFLIAIQEDTEAPSEEQLSEIKRIVEKLQDDDIIDTKIQTLSIIIENGLREKRLSTRQFYTSLNENLSKGKYENLADDLKHVVEALDHEYSHALAKMKEI